MAKIQISDLSPASELISDLNKNEINMINGGGWVKDLGDWIDKNWSEIKKGVVDAINAN